MGGHMDKLLTDATYILWHHETNASFTMNHLLILKSWKQSNRKEGTHTDINEVSQ